MDDWSVRKRRRRHETPNRDVVGFGCGRCCRLESLHLSDALESARYGRPRAGSRLSDLPDCDCQPTPARILLCPSCEYFYVCVGLFGCGNHAAALQTSFAFTLTHYRKKAMRGYS